jgi:hypothetical protein
VPTIGSQVAVKLSASGTSRALLTTNIFISVSDTHLYQRLSKPQDPLEMEGLGKLIEITDLIGLEPVTFRLT